jgi:hypothetical protein
MDACEVAPRGAVLTGGHPMSAVVAYIDTHKSSVGAMAPAGRHLLAPTAAGSIYKRYSDFRFEGFLDWVAVRLTLVRPTQTRYLREALPESWSGGGEAPYVKSAGGEKCQTDTVFTLRIQDPRSAKSIEHDIARLAARFALARPPEIVGIECGVDAYATGPSASLVDMAETFYRCLSAPASTNRRITGAIGTTGTAKSGAESRRQNRAALERGQTLVIGNQTDPVAHRVYIKEGVRARCEVTLQGSAVPFKTLDEWAMFGFEKLSNHFRWRMHKESAAGMQQVLRDRQVVLAGYKAPTSTHRRGRVHKVGTVADNELRDEALKALRRLSTAQRKGAKPTRKLSITEAGLNEILMDFGSIPVTFPGEAPDLLNTTFSATFSTTTLNITTTTNSQDLNLQQAQSDSIQALLDTLDALDAQDAINDLIPISIPEALSDSIKPGIEQADCGSEASSSSIHPDHPDANSLHVFAVRLGTDDHLHDQPVASHVQKNIIAMTRPGIVHARVLPPGARDVCTGRAGRRVSIPCRRLASAPRSGVTIKTRRDAYYNGWVGLDLLVSQGVPTMRTARTSGRPLMRRCFHGENSLVLWLRGTAPAHRLNLAVASGRYPEKATRTWARHLVCVGKIHLGRHSISTAGIGEALKQLERRG